MYSVGKTFPDPAPPAFLALDFFNIESWQSRKVKVLMAKSVLFFDM